jgi:hypothetical protein
MVLSDNEIKQLIRDPKNKVLIDYLISMKKENELHLTGHGLNEFLTTVDGVEDKDYINVKKKLANTITVKAFEKVLRPKDKIASAKGGTVIYEFGSDNDKTKETFIKEIIKNLDFRGYGLSDFITQIWLDYGIWLDPMAVTLVGKVYEEVATLDGIFKQETDRFKLEYISPYERINGKIYQNFHDISFHSFDNLDYIIINIGEDEKKNKLYRIIDSEKDVIYTWLHNTETIKEVENSMILHGFGKVPGVFNSNKVDKKTENKSFTSYCSEAMVIAKDFLNDYTDFRIYKKKLAIPRFWELKTKCKNCDGTGRVHSTDEEGGKRLVNCPICNGEGIDTRRNLTDITQLDVLDKETQNNIPPFGAVTIPVDIQVQLLKELDAMEFDLAEIVWGQGSAVSKEKTDTTAFEVSVRNEGKIDKLRRIENNRVAFKRAIISLIGKRSFDDFNGVIITPNEQFLMLTPTENRALYLESKKGLASDPQLDKIWDDYLISEYENNPIELERQRKIKLLTPLFHYTLIEAKDLLTPSELDIKKNLDKYIHKFESEGKNILTSEVDEIIKAFESYIKIQPIQGNIFLGRNAVNDITTGT